MTCYCCTGCEKRHKIEDPREREDKIDSDRNSFGFHAAGLNKWPESTTNTTATKQVT